jgi:photosystem II stability/assembly factor-like uncharacterized protein
MPDLRTPSDVYSDEDGAVFVQREAGQETFYIGNCLEVGDIPNPRGGAEPQWCLNSDREHVVIGQTATAPGTGSVTITGLMENTANWLETYVEDFCPFWLYFIQHKCGTRGLFSHWERAAAVRVQAVPEDTISGFMSREGGNQSTRAFNFSFFSPRIDSRNMTVSRKTTTGFAQSFNDITACDKECPSPCDGAGIGLGQELQIAVDCNTGVATADYVHSHDYGSTWAAAAADPFGVNTENAISSVCFPIDKTTTRWLTIRSATAATDAEVSYSDDGGANWTEAVILPSANNVGALGPQSLFAFDQDHIWAALGDGDVYFSSDAGVTWVSQSAAAASGGNALWAISFYDANVGYAVGASDTVIKTVDGGANWTAATATGAGNTNRTVQTRKGGEWVIVGETGGEIYISWDGAATWTATPAARHPGATVGSVQCIDMFNDLLGLCAHDNASPVGTVLHTIDGGYTWTALTTPTNQGLNSVIMLSPTQGWAVGEVDTTAVILEISTL